MAISVYHVIRKLIQSFAYLTLFLHEWHSLHSSAQEVKLGMLTYSGESIQNTAVQQNKGLVFNRDSSTYVLLFVKSTCRGLLLVPAYDLNGSSVCFCHAQTHSV